MPTPSGMRAEVFVIFGGDYNTAHNDIDLKNPKANEDRSGFFGRRLSGTGWMKLWPGDMWTRSAICIRTLSNIPGGPIGSVQGAQRRVAH
ncbi:MAG: hypothetical protein R2861_10345 [Desulfobacterales bacterium]